MPIDDRNTAEQTWAFTKAAGTGIKEGAVGLVEGLWSLAKGGYHIATDPQAREQAWDTTKKLADAANQYAQKSIDDPGKPFRDAGNKALQLKNAYNAAYSQAAANGKLPEFFGKGIGRGGFEVGTFALGAGEVGMIGKAGEAAEGMGALAKLGEAESLLSNPVLRVADESISAITKCPLELLAGKPDLLAKVHNFSEDLKGLSVATEKDNLLIYSGIGRIPGAEISKMPNIVAAIDRTEAGIAIQSFEAELAGAGLNRSQIFSITEPMWRETSVRLASEASGKVTAVMGPVVRDNAVIYDELHALGRNANVHTVEILHTDEIGKVIKIEHR